jgi:limonene-1,2-epoxide hydrolase
VNVDQARAVFDRRRAAWLAEDLDGYMACWVDDMVIEVPGRTITGIDAYRALAAGSFAWARPVDFDVHHLAVDGEVVLADWTITVERRSDQVPVTWRGMSACRLAPDGRIVWWREYYEDPVGLHKARSLP